MDWQSIKIGDTTESFFISIKNEYNEQFTFNLCNFKELWRETIAWQDVIGRAKVSLSMNRKIVQMLHYFREILLS